MFKNMKIEINEQQPLDVVVAELERLDYKHEYELNDESKLVCTFTDGVYVDFIDTHTDESFQIVTLSELLEMQE